MPILGQSDPEAGDVSRETLNGQLGWGGARRRIPKNMSLKAVALIPLCVTILILLVVMIKRGELR